MNLTSKEHYDLMAHFEQGFKSKPEREPKEIWRHSIYCDGATNRDFLKFREGYALAKAINLNHTKTMPLVKFTSTKEEMP